MARDMYGPMTGASAWMMTPQWDGPHLALLWAMWAVMMIAMMLPSATPMILLAGGRSGPTCSPRATWWRGRPSALAPPVAVGTRAPVAPQPDDGSLSRSVGGIFLLIAGIYQWTPLKQACLTTCQSPLAFVMRRFRSGSWGAFRMGVEHGTYCVGCCWALMLLLCRRCDEPVVVAALTAFVAFEKLASYGVASARISGTLLVTAGAWMLVR